MARMLTDVMEREAYEDALDPVPDDDLPSSDIDDLSDDHDLDEPDDAFEDAAALVAPDPDEDDIETFDADGEPLPDDVQAEIEAIAAEGLAADEPPDEMPEPLAEPPSEAPPEKAAARLETHTDASPEATRTLVLEQALEAAQRELAHQRDLACAAVARYRQAVLAAEPDLPPEMVHGENIEDVDASIAAARTMVAHVREQVEARRPSERGFPAGAPARDTSARGHLTARQKIAAGLQERLI
jgi:hypothetical protein